jgi:hypothetical protein
MHAFRFGWDGGTPRVGSVLGATRNGIGGASVWRHPSIVIVVLNLIVVMGCDSTRVAFTIRLQLCGSHGDKELCLGAHGWNLSHAIRVAATLKSPLASWQQLRSTIDVAKGS